MLKKRSWKDLLSQADPEKDCVAAPVVEADEEEHEAEWQAVGARQEALPAPQGGAARWPWAERPKVTGRGLLPGIEKINLAVESLVNRLIGASVETQPVASLLNPFYHTGTLAVFLLIVIAVTGLYLTIFYVVPGLGTMVAYDAVAALDNHWLGLGRIMRGVHRYASGAAVIATLLHALRTLFQDRLDRKSTRL